MKYGEIVEYNGSQLFSGAIDIDNFLDVPEKAKAIVDSYIFHGKTYHSGSTTDFSSNGHALTDSITFTEKVIEALESDEPEMMIGIAGYGVGKSHLGLTLTSFLSSKDPSVRSSIINRIASIDKEAADRIESVLSYDDRPYLVIPINGMRNTNLKDLFFVTIKRILKRDGVDSSCLDDFDPRFEALRNLLINYGNVQLVDSILSSVGLSRQAFSARMMERDNDTYELVYKALKNTEIKFFPPAAIGELKDIISEVAKNLCGEDKPYRAMLIVFDELGKYMAFAAANDGVAGPGCMQLLMEGVHATESSDGHVVLLGLSQLDLKEYQRGVGDIAFSNTMSRYVTRYDSAKRYYLSACFETLVANLIQVKNKDYIPSINNPAFLDKVSAMRSNITNCFKAAASNPIWNTDESFTRLISRGCWPLSPYLLWTLTYITSMNNLLQQRSGFNILSNLFNEQIYDVDYVENDFIPAVGLFDAGLGLEFLDAERNFSTMNPIATEYQFFLSKYENTLSLQEVKVLKAIVLTHKLSANCLVQNTLDSLLCELTGLSKKDVSRALKSLINDYNAVAYNSNLRLYEIHSDSVSINQFNEEINAKVRNYRAIRSQQELFDSVVSVMKYAKEFEDISKQYFGEVECDFAGDHDITTEEWVYSPKVVIGYNYLDEISELIDVRKYLACVNHSDPKGSVIYVVLPKDISVDIAKKSISSLYAAREKEAGFIIPAMCLLFSDEDGTILNASIELSVIDQLTEDEVSKYTTLIPKRKETLYSSISAALENEGRKKQYVYPITTSAPLKIAGSQLFEETYPDVIPFEIDGVSNWCNTANKFTQVFARGIVTWNDFSNLGNLDARRAKRLFNLWECLESNGKFLRIPGHDVLAEIFERYDEMLANGENIDIYDFFEELMRPPYGANSTEATLLISMYFSVRLFEVDFFDRSGKMFQFNDRFNTKGSVDSKNKAFVKNKWIGTYVHKAIRDDAKWCAIVSKWKSSDNIQDILALSAEASELERNNVSIPPNLTMDLAACYARSKSVEDIYMKFYENLPLSKKIIESKIAEERVGSTLYAFAEQYVPLVDDTYRKLEKLDPPVKMSEEEITEDEAFRSYVVDYLNGSFDTWSDDHPIDYSAVKDEFDKIMNKYRATCNSLNKVGLNLIANDLSYDMELYRTKRTAYLNYRHLKQEIESSYDTIRKTLLQGIYSSAQVVSIKKQLSDLLNKIDQFMSANGKIIPEQNFDELKNAMLKSFAAVDEVGKKKDEAFGKLFDIDIQTLSDLTQIIDITSDLITFYKGQQASLKNENLADAKDMKLEAELLKDAYLELSDKTLSVAGLKKCLDDSKASIDKALKGGGLFDDDGILEGFAGRFEADIYSRGRDWLQDINARMSIVKNVHDVEKVLFSIESAPKYVEGIFESEIEHIKMRAADEKSAMRLDQVKSLFIKLNDIEKKAFVDWCKDK